MENRKCLYCGEPIPQSRRADSKFCSHSCKARHWEEQKNKSSALKLLLEHQPSEPIPKQETLSEGLRGVLDVSNEKNDVKLTHQKDAEISENAVPDYIMVNEQVETTRYKEANDTLNKGRQIITALKKGIADCNEQIKQIQDQTIKLLPATGITLGGYVGSKEGKEKLLPTVLGASVGWGIGKVLDMALFERIGTNKKKRKLVVLRK